MEKVLLFFSGGNDSTLSACKLASRGYDVHLITFDNGCEEGIENVRNRATILERLFENSTVGKVRNLGVFQSVSEFMALRHENANMPFSKIVSCYGDFNQNQLNCLNCRSAMYVVGVVVATELGISHIAEGARKTQLFALEQEELLEGYRSLLNQYDIDLLLPVYDYESDYEVENELNQYSTHFYDSLYDETTSYEAKCWLGTPMDGPLTKEEISGYSKFYQEVLRPVMRKRIEMYPTYPIQEQLDHPVYTKIKFR